MLHLMQWIHVVMRLSREDHGVDATTVLYSRNEFYFVGDVWMDEMLSNSKQSSYSIYEDIH